MSSLLSSPSSRARTSLSHQIQEDEQPQQQEQQRTKHHRRRPSSSTSSSSSSSSSRCQFQLLWMKVILGISIFFSFHSPTTTTCEAALTCDSTLFCEQQLRPGSICLKESKTCSNPYYQKGCLATRLPEDDIRFQQYPSQRRVCNSDDYDNENNDKDDSSSSSPPSSSHCHKPNSNDDEDEQSYFKYNEIRIHNGNWESSIFLSWIMQILLMEVVHVPVTIGLGGHNNPTKNASFYNLENTLSYSTEAYPFHALEEATNVNGGNCQLSNNNNNKECCHILPETWNGQVKEWTKALSTGYIDPVEGNGQVGKGSWYVPSFTAKRDDTLLSFYGLSGEQNRHKLATSFRKPITWLEYCTEISLTNCTTTTPTTTTNHDDDEVNQVVVASRYPTTPEEGSLYYAGPGKYLGHFRLTEANNCTLHPTTCAGHIIGPPCSWSTNVDSQLYWNGITLQPDGPVLPNGGYDYNQMLQIWRAANATKSNVMFWWWRPDALVEEFYNTDAQFQQVLLPEATDLCSNARVDTEARCSNDIMERRGSPLGACDQEAHALQKIFSKSLREQTYDRNIPIALRSPGYDMLQSLKVTDLEINHMIRTWLGTNIDRYGNDAREAVCDFVVDNLDTLLDTVPAGYPRLISEQSSFHIGYLYAAQAVAIFTALVVVAVSTLTVMYRKTQVFIYTQVYLCWLILFGFFIVSIGSMVTAMEPKQSTCTSRAWLITLGYTIEIVPLLVKIAAINKILQSAKKMRRVQISPRKMLIKVIAVVVIITTYLTIWTIIDPPREREYLTLESEQSQVVFISLACNSHDHEFWYMLTLGWHVLLLVMASALAFQSRNVIQEFNESRSLGTMVYSHFLFILLRTGVYFLGRHSTTEGGGFTTTLAPNVVAAAESILLSLDALFAMVIYIFPKLHEAIISPETKHRGWTKSGHSVAMSNISMIESRAAEAQASYRSNQSAYTDSFSSSHGDDRTALGGWGSLRRSASRRRLAAQSNRSALRTSAESVDSGGRLSDGNLFSAGLVPVGKNTQRSSPISIVPEASCEFSTSSFPLVVTPMSIQNMSLEMGDVFENFEGEEEDQRRASSSSSSSWEEGSPELAKPEPSDDSLNDDLDKSTRSRTSTSFRPSIAEKSMSFSSLHPKSNHDRKSSKLLSWSLRRNSSKSLLGMSSWHSNKSVEKSLRLSSLYNRASDHERSRRLSSSDHQRSHRLTSLQSPSEDGELEFHESFTNKGSSDDDEDEYDSGGPQWSNPELNEELNRSVRTVDETHLHITPSGRPSKFRTFTPLPMIRSESIESDTPLRTLGHRQTSCPVQSSPRGAINVTGRLSYQERKKPPMSSLQTPHEGEEILFHE